MGPVTSACASWAAGPTLAMRKSRAPPVDWRRVRSSARRNRPAPARDRGGSGGSAPHNNTLSAPSGRADECGAPRTHHPEAPMRCGTTSNNSSRACGSVGGSSYLVLSVAMAGQWTGLAWPHRLHRPPEEDLPPPLPQSPSAAHNALHRAGPHPRPSAEGTGGDTGTTGTQPLAAGRQRAGAARRATVPHQRSPVDANSEGTCGGARGRCLTPDGTADQRPSFAAPFWGAVLICTAQCRGWGGVTAQRTRAGTMSDRSRQQFTAAMLLNARRDGRTPGALGRPATHPPHVARAPAGAHERTTTASHANRHTLGHTCKREWENRAPNAGAHSSDSPPLLRDSGGGTVPATHKDP